MAMIILFRNVWVNEKALDEPHTWSSLASKFDFFNLFSKNDGRTLRNLSQD